MRQLTDTLKAEEVKQLQATLTAIQNERLAAEKAKDGNKGKKKKGAIFDMKKKRRNWSLLLSAAASKRAEDFAEDDFVDDDLDAFMWMNVFAFYHIWSLNVSTCVPSIHP